MFSLLRRVMPRLAVLPVSPAVRARPMRKPPAKFAASRVVSTISAALLCTLVSVAFAGAFGQLVFSGPLSPYMSRGIFAALLSTVVMLVILPWRGAFGFSVGGPDSNPSAVLAVTLTAIAQTMTASSVSTPAELLPTVLAYMFVSATTCGAVVWLLGARRGGRCVRYIPYPVIGGFLAGSGYLLVAGAFKALTGARLSFESLELLRLVNPFAATVALVVATLLIVGTRRLRHYLVIPAVIVGSVLLFHAMRSLLGIDLEMARAQGLLLPSMDSGFLAMDGLQLADVRWDVILHHTKDVAAMIAVVVVTALMNTTSVEVATGRDGDADRELRAIGLSNVIAGFFGGMVASNSFNRTILNFRAGAESPWATRCCAMLIAGGMILAPAPIGLLPRPVLTGLILYLGLTLLMTWTVDARRTLTRLDYAVVLAILGVVAVLGIVSGVVLGIFIACVSFAVTMSRGRNVRQAFTAENRRSNVERTPNEAGYLRTRGGAVRGFTLDGVLFFGTATRLLEEIRGSLAKTRIVLLDFRLVQGIDGSAIVALKRLYAICRDAEVRLVVTGLSPAFQALLTRGGLEFGPNHVWRFADLDRGLEWCEETLLSEGGAEPPSLRDALADALSVDGRRVLLESCERREIAAGAVLVRQGDPSDEMFFIERGRVQVLLPLMAGRADDAARLRTYGAGTVVGEMGFFSGEPRSADIVAEVDTALFCLTRERLELLQRTHPEFGHALHRFVILTLAQRLRAANDGIRELL